MNIEIANRLVKLRKANNLSQEALAEKLGISRQAVSKWERAEASPDTDNLILLAKLYKISLDELLMTDEDAEEYRREDTAKEDSAKEGYVKEDYIEEESKTIEQERTAEDEGEYAHIGFEGIHVKDKDGEVHIGWNGIHVTGKGDEVHIDKDGINVNGESLKEHVFTRGNKADFFIGLTITILYIAIGCIYNVWHPTWIIFFLIPIISSAIDAIKRKRADLFAYPVLVVMIFLYFGFVESIWHPTWVLFLTIPIYYVIIKFVS